MMQPPPACRMSPRQPAPGSSVWKVYWPSIRNGTPIWSSSPATLAWIGLKRRWRGDHQLDLPVLADLGEIPGLPHGCGERLLLEDVDAPGGALLDDLAAGVVRDGDNREVRGHGVQQLTGAGESRDLELFLPLPQGVGVAVADRDELGPRPSPSRTNRSTSRPGSAPYGASPWCASSLRRSSPTVRSTVSPTSWTASRRADVTGSKPTPSIPKHDLPNEYRCSCTQG